MIQFYNGLSSELYTASHFAQEGYEIFWPMQTQSRADFLIFKDGQALKVQCKKATWSKAGNYNYLQTRLSSRNKDSQPLYQEGDFDLLVVTDLEKIWVIPYQEVKGLTSLCLLSTKPTYKSRASYDAATWRVK